mgnify:CR=1 FL=1
MKLTWEKIENKDIIFLENNYANLKLDKKIKTYKLSNKEINIRYLIKAIIKYFFSFKRLSLKENYIIEIFENCKPKIVFGYAYNFFLFKIKKIYPNIKSLMYMHFAMRKEQFAEYKSILKRGEVDCIFLSNPREKIFLKKFIKSKFIISGFLKNNEIKSKINKKEYDVMIISEYRDNMEVKKKNIMIASLSKLSETIKKNKLKLCIALVSNRKEKVQKVSFKNELEFYQNLGLKFYYSNESSYELANRSKIIFCLNSNLGYELIARKYRVFFFNVKNNIYLKKYPFATNVLNRKFEKLIIMLKNINKKKFEKLLSNSKVNFYFDQNNKIVKNHIKKIINEQ